MTRRTHITTSIFPFPHQQSSSSPIDILLVEDSPQDVRLIREGFEMTTNDHETRLHVVTDGDTLVEFLRRSADDEQTPSPDLVLLDLNLPARDGADVLDAINDDQRTRYLPVIILTDSDAVGDIVRCYDAHANAYLTKPTGLSGFVSIAESIEAFWIGQARLPTSSS